MASRWRFLAIMIILLVSLVAAATPALATTEGTDVTGSPDLKATLAGSNEFPAGEPGALQIVVLNNGLFTGDVKNPADQAMARGYSNAVGATVVPPCTTATAVTATLVSPSDSIQIMSDPAGIGTLPTGASTPQPISFQIRVAQNAAPTTFQLSLELSYRYLENVTWLNAPEQNSPYYVPQFQFQWGQKEQTQNITIKVFGTYFSVTDIKTSSVRPGATGIITATIENSGAGEAADGTAEIVPGGIFTPVDSGVFLGDLNGGDAQAAAFKVAVSPEAIAKTAPAQVLIKYKDENNVARQTTVTIGVPVGAAEDDFTVADIKTEAIRAGSTGIITLTLQDQAAGDTYETTAEVVPGAYFTPVDGRRFIGDLTNGGSSTARFKVSVAQDAIASSSPLGIKITYNDANNIQRQYLVTVGIPVAAAPTFEVSRVEGNLVPGGTDMISVPIKNTSRETLFDAVARINVVDPFATAPFSTTDEAAYIGTLQPGEAGTVEFKLTVDSEAVPKTYTLEVQVKYRDSLNNSYVSDAIDAPVTVQPPPRFSTTTLVFMGLGALVVIIIIVSVVRRRRK
jgi:hypothetical protein